MLKIFPGARVRCMQDYVRLTIRENPDHIILHVGTNGLTTNIPTEKVTESIINLASSLRSNSFNVAISSITVRNDRYRKKVAQVNRHLKTLCSERNFELISHENIITEKQLNRSKLHLNKRGTAIFRGGSRAAATSKMECFVIIVSNFQPLTVITKHSILDVAAVLDTPLILSNTFTEAQTANTQTPLLTLFYV